MSGKVKKVYKLLKKKIPLEFDGLSFSMLFGFIPIPTPHFKKTQLRRHPTKKRALKPPTVKVDTDPVTDTSEEFRQDAIDQGDYFSAFGAAFFKNAYEKNKKQNPQPA